MKGEGKRNTNGTNDGKKIQKLSDYIEYVHKHIKCSIGLAYKRRLIIGIYKK